MEVSGNLTIQKRDNRLNMQEKAPSTYRGDEAHYRTLHGVRFGKDGCRMTPSIERTHDRQTAAGWKSDSMY